MKISLLGLLNKPKAVVTGIVGATGITTPSVIASQKGGEVTILAEEVSEVKIELEDKESSLTTMKADYEKVKELAEQRRKWNETFQTMLSGISEASRKRDEENAKLIELLQRDKDQLLKIIKGNMGNGFISALAEYASQRCSLGYCNELTGEGEE